MSRASEASSAPEDHAPCRFCHQAWLGARRRRACHRRCFSLRRDRNVSLLRNMFCFNLFAWLAAEARECRQSLQLSHGRDKRKKTAPSRIASISHCRRGSDVRSGPAIVQLGKAGQGPAKAMSVQLRKSRRGKSRAWLHSVPPSMRLFPGGPVQVARCRAHAQKIDPSHQVKISNSEFVQLNKLV